jgi:outer membrane protein assembly factor BamB
VAADGRVYFLNRSGVCTVVAAAPRFERLATNRVAGETVASPAVANGRIYLRSRGAVYCIGAR